MRIHHPHDKLVRKMLTDKHVAIDLLKNSLPAETIALLDLSTLQPTTETGINEAWRAYRNDVVFHCKTKAQKNVYIIIEHQSTPDRFMPLRILRYKCNLLGKYLDAKNPPPKIPNVISLVIYHGKKEYPYSTDIVACFEDEKLAARDVLAPMCVLDLKKMSEEALLGNEGADTLLKFLLKHSREKDFIQKLQALMEQKPEIFVSLSIPQAQFVFEYALYVGKGTPANASIMRTAMNQLYGKPKAQKIFSLADYFREEAKKKVRKEGIQEGMRKGVEKGRKEGIQEGIQKGRQEGIQQGVEKAIKRIVATGKLTQKEAEEMVLGE